VDTRKEAIAVQEARQLRIPVVGIVDTNCDPDEVDYVVPGNDDALRAIRLFAGRIADAVLAGRRLTARRARPRHRGPRAPGTGPRPPVTRPRAARGAGPRPGRWRRRRPRPDRRPAGINGHGEPAKHREHKRDGE